MQPSLTAAATDILLCVRVWIAHRTRVSWFRVCEQAGLPRSARPQERPGAQQPIDVPFSVHRFRYVGRRTSDCSTHDDAHAHTYPHTAARPAAFFQGALVLRPAARPAVRAAAL